MAFVFGIPAGICESHIHIGDGTFAVALEDFVLVGAKYRDVVAELKLVVLVVGREIGREVVIVDNIPSISVRSRLWSRVERKNK